VRKVEAAAEEIELEKWDSSRDSGEDAFCDRLEQGRLVVPETCRTIPGGGFDDIFTRMWSNSPTISGFY